MNDVYQIGMPVERLSTVIMLWVAYERCCSLEIKKAKTEDWAVVELKHSVLAAEITDTVKDCKVRIMKVNTK